MATVSVENELDWSSDDELDGSNKSTKVQFMDEDLESDDSDTEIVKSSQITKSKLQYHSLSKSIRKYRPIMDYILIDANNYHYKNWHECFPDKQVQLQSLLTNPAWGEFFNLVQRKNYYKRMEQILSGYLQAKTNHIVPHAELVFSAFNTLSPDKIRVVIIGQDPYPGANTINSKLIPEATGFSFSAPLNYPKPKSLQNIYANLQKFGHLKEIPQTGSLSSWILQGCFLLNSALTTFYTERGVHRNVWRDFTQDLIAYINSRCNNVVFMIWGRDANGLCKYVDPNRHCIITSSHPSPLGFNKQMRGFEYGEFKDESKRRMITYDPFEMVNHFGRANEYLKSCKKREIFWDM